MTHPWDEFSKSLAEPLPRRESLRRLGAAFAGAALMPFSLAWGAPKAGGPDPCKAFCNQCPKSTRSQCLAACQACHSNSGQLVGFCGNYRCCGSGLASCLYYCADLANDVHNCGECGYVCPQPGPNEYGACIDGYCEYACAEGAVRCNGTCTYLGSDPDNCGACGNVCGGQTPHCDEGTCVGCPPGLAACNNSCVNLDWDSRNCGACGNVCPASDPVCNGGICSGCLNSLQTNCGGYCTYLDSDPQNCGACGFVCLSNSCVDGMCDSPGGEE